ncbi:hypothetical protein F5B20DRAFT_580915 [Whalleya microplaca]|nr:hypothetical protein F5B20DRAFT_580915 [Whalleya microplaca]
MADIQFNSYNPSCDVSQCLQQVAGYLDNNPLAQYSACTSTFGTPVVSTVTPSAEVVFSTIVDTVSYTDVVVSLSTTYSIYDQVETLYTDFVDTITDVSTSTTTVTTTVTSVSTTPVITAVKRQGKKDACKPKRPSSPSDLASSITSSAPEVSSSATYPTFSNASSSAIYSAASNSSSSTTYSFTLTNSSSSTAYYSVPSSSSSAIYSSALNSSTSATYSSASESTPESTSSTTSSSSSSPVIPIASYCSNLAEYSSACACIDAVSTTSIVTAPSPTSISTVSSTVSTSIPSVSVSVITVVITVPVSSLATSTQTTTQTTVSVVTETTTSIYTPTPSPHLKITSSTNTARVGRYITLGTGNSGAPCLQWDSGNKGVSSAGNFTVVDGVSWALRDSPLLTAYAHPTAAGTLSVVCFETAAAATSASDVAVTCGVGSTGVLTCGATLGYDTFVICGGWVYIVPAAKASSYVSSYGCVIFGMGLST